MISGEIESLAFGGKGILRHEGQVVFVPYTAPGDRITCRVTHQAKSYSEAKMISLETPGAQRTDPRCPYFGTCGGCQLQHLNYAEQLYYKRKSVIDALQRIGKLDHIKVDAVVPAETRWAYRRHITLTLNETQGAFQTGYIADDHRTFLPVTQCPIFLDPSEPLLQQVQELARQLKASTGNSGKVVLLKLQDKGYFLQWHFKHLPPNAIATVEKALSEHEDWAGCSIATRKSLHHLGDEELTLALEGLSIRFSPRAFIQNHPEQSLKIYRMILAEAAGAVNALDFYCGIGIASLLLARQGVFVKGVEQNREAIKTARANSVLNGCSKATFVEADVKTVARDLLETVHPDFVIVNPPREGMEREVTEALGNSSLRRLVYISCMPATLARDLSLLYRQGYGIERCQPFDMFPQTGHVETVTVLVRN